MEDACSTGVQVGDKLLKAHAALEPGSIILIMKLENIPILHHGEITYLNYTLHFAKDEFMPVACFKNRWDNTVWKLNAYYHRELLS